MRRLSWTCIASFGAISLTSSTRIWPRLALRRDSQPGSRAYQSSSIRTMDMCFTATLVRVRRLCFWLSSAYLGSSPIVLLWLATSKKTRLRGSMSLRRKLVAIPLGLPLEPFVTAGDARGELRRHMGIENEVPVVGIVARLVPIKAHEYFLKAAQRICAQRDDVHFAVVGDGERREELETMCRDLGIADRVHFLGWRRDMGPFMQTST